MNITTLEEKEHPKPILSTEYIIYLMPAEHNMLPQLHRKNGGVEVRWSPPVRAYELERRVDKGWNTPVQHGEVQVGWNIVEWVG